MENGIHNKRIALIDQSLRGLFLFFFSGPNAAWDAEQGSD